MCKSDHAANLEQCVTSAGVVTRWSAPVRVVSPTNRRSLYSDVGISTGCHQQPLPAINTSPVPAVFVSLAGLRTARQSGNRKPAPSTACDSLCFIQSLNPRLECFSFRDLCIVHPHPTPFFFFFFFFFLLLIRTIWLLKSYTKPGDSVNKATREERSITH